jgi:5,10-methylenetetrahydromethanopterin reductase
MAEGDIPMSDAAADLGIAIWGTQPVAHLVEDVRRAERMGFESAWVIDSQLLCRDVFVTMASCLSATSTIKLATGVTNPITRHVSVTAGALASLDEAYPARVIAGVGTGFSSLRTIGMGAARVAELEAFVRDLQGLLAAEAVPFERCSRLAGRRCGRKRPLGDSSRCDSVGAAGDRRDARDRA